MQKSNLREWTNPVAIATYIGAIGSYIAYLKEFDLLAITFLSVLVLILTLNNLIVYRRYVKYKRYTTIDTELHRLTHRTRDFIGDLRMTTYIFEAEEKSASAIKGALTTAANIFTLITGDKCTASLMLEKSGALRTYLYCHQVDPERENKPSGEMPSGEGIAGQAFTTGDVVVWGDQANSFRKIRQDHEAFYRSGMSIPFRAGQKYAGLLNIDTLTANAFQKNPHKQIGATVADQIGVIIECNNLWRDLSEV